MKQKIPTIDVENQGINVCQATKSGFIFCPVGGIFDSSYPKSKLRRGRVQGNGHVCPTITTSPDNLWIVENIRRRTVMKVKKIRVRKLTERECFRLMGLRDDEIDKIFTSGVSRGNLYKMAGNSIVIDPLENVFRTLLVEKNSEKGHANKLF